MARISARVKNHIPMKKGQCKTEVTIFEATQNCLNTLFDIRCATKSTWGYDWYDDARYGCYNSARRKLATKPDCFSKVVAFQCIDELEMLREEAKNLG